MTQPDPERSNKPTLPDYGTIGPRRSRRSQTSEPELAPPSIHDPKSAPPIPSGTERK
jgi:hypothetical protein